MRASIVLGVVAALLLAFILLYERGSLTSRELEQRKGSVLVELQRDRLEKIELQRKGVVTVLERDLTQDDEDALWKVTAPYRASADSDAVETLLSELEWLHAQRSLGTPSAEDRKRFGLNAPRFRVWLTVGRARVPVLVGSPSADGKGVYVGAGEPLRAFVVGKDFAESLSHEPEHFHDKALHDGVMMMTTRALSLRDAAGERTARLRDHGFFELEAPYAGLASEPAIEAVVDAADALRASRYVGESIGSDHGLLPPKRELRLYKRERRQKEPADPKPSAGPSAQKPQPENPTDEYREVIALHLRVGSPCKGHAGESYIATGDKGPLYCALDTDLEKLFPSLDALHETRLLPVEDDEVKAITVEQAGAKLEVTKTEEGFDYVRTSGSGRRQAGSAREGAVSDWLAALRATKARPATAAGVSGLTAGKWRVTVTRGESKKPFTLEVLRAGPAELELSRSFEQRHVLIDASSAHVLDADAARLRPLTLHALDESAVNRLEIRRDNVIERLERQASGPLAVVKPFEAPADAALASDAARLLGRLEAVRFAADEPRPEHGLAVPAITAAVEHAASDDAKAGAFELRVGAQTAGGRFAQLSGDPAVFVISTQLGELLSRPLVSRTLLATPLDRIARIELAHRSRTVLIERNPGGFAAKPAGALSDETSHKLAELTSTLRAEHSLGYSQGPLAKPELRIGVEQTDGSRYAITVGAASDGGAPARRDDLPVELRLPASTLEAFTGALRAN